MFDKGATVRPLAPLTRPRRSLHSPSVSAPPFEDRLAAVIQQLMATVNDPHARSDHAAAIREALGSFHRARWCYTVSGGKQRDPATGRNHLLQAHAVLVPWDSATQVLSDDAYATTQAALRISADPPR
jgi:hypothetical protein